MHDLKDVTFMIPVKLDSEDRKTNLRIILNYLYRHFDTNIIVYESDVQSNEKFIRSLVKKPIHYMYEKIKDGIFHRTRLLNEMTIAANTPIIVNYDADVVLQPFQYIHAQKLINGQDKIDMVMAYQGPCLDIPKDLFDLVENDKITEIDPKKCTLMNPMSVGGAVFHNKERYLEAGLENERFVSWGYEDNERVLRLQKLGQSIARTHGYCWHLTHSRDQNGWFNNPYIQQNKDEFAKIQQLNEVELNEYVNTWNYGNITQA